MHGPYPRNQRRLLERNFQRILTDEEKQRAELQTKLSQAEGQLRPY